MMCCVCDVGANVCVCRFGSLLGVDVVPRTLTAVDVSVGAETQNERARATTGSDFRFRRV